MFEKAIVLGIYGVTAVHAGSGSELSVIDLPIQRERYTQFPIIWGQSLKGVLRAEYKSKDDSEEKIKTGIIFGPEKDASEHAAAISVGDAKVLLFPVRSLKGVFAYVTCPMVLERFSEDLALARKSVEGTVTNLKPAEREGIVNNTSSSLVIEGKKLVLEDVLLVEEEEDLSKVIELIANFTPVSEEKLKEKLVIVNDDLFTAFVTMTTEIVARTRIDAGSGTVQAGALWYEEYLPSDALLYSVIAIGKPRLQGKNEIEKILKSLGAKDMEEVVNKIAEELATFDNSFLQIGGDETVGKGFVKVKVFGKSNKRIGKNE